MTDEATVASGTRRGAWRAALTGGRITVGGALRLLGRSVLPLLATLVASIVLLAVLFLPLWIWLNAAVEMIKLDPGAPLGNGEIAKLVVLLGVPAVIVLGILVLAALGGFVVVLDDIAEGRKTQPVRAVGRGLRAVPRLAATLVPAFLLVVLLVAATPLLTVAGLLLVPVTLVGRRFGPARRWPSRRTLVLMVVPFALATVVAARLLVLPAVVMLERPGVRASFRRSRSMSSPRVGELATVVIGFGLVLFAVVNIADRVLAARDATQTTHDLLAAGIQVFGAVILVGIAVRLFVDAGGVPVAPPKSTNPRVALAMVVAFALVAGLSPALIMAAPANAAGSNYVVNNLGDDGDDNPGDGFCATEAGVCTLRAAIMEANMSTGKAIGFSVSGTITVGSELRITATMTIDGAGQKVTVSGGNATGVFSIQSEGPVLGGAIRNLTIADGYEPGTGGAAVFNGGSTVDYMLENLTIRNNMTPGSAVFGGAVMNFSQLTILNSTFVNNTTETSNPSDVDNRFGGELTISHSTFSGSTGSPVIGSSGVSLDVTNSVITATAATLLAPASAACFGSITGAGNVSTDSPAVCPGTTANATQLALQPLADNGGPTQTVRLGSASVAIDAGSSPACVAVDQRGVSRPKGSTCDAGAYEFDPATTTALTATPNPSAFGQSVSLQATVSATGETDQPTGTVQFKDGASSLGSPVSLVAGVASLPLSTLASGPHSLTAVYVPDARYKASTSPVVSHTVNATSTTVTITSSGSPSIGGTPVTFTITVASGSTPTGTVTLVDGSTPLTAPLTLDGTGKASFTTSTLIGGHHVLTSAYSGDANHAAANATPFNHDVVSPSTTTLTGPSGPTVFGNAATFTATVTPTGGGVTPTGTVTFTAGALNLGSTSLSGGQAMIAVTTLPPGTHSVVASYAGDSFNNASTSSPFNVTVTNAATSTAVTVTPASTSVYGTQVTVKAKVTAPTSAATPVGSITILDGADVIGSGAIDANGEASVSLFAPVAGNHSFHADFTPGTGFTSSSSSPVSHTVDKASTSTGLTATSSSSAFGQSVTLDATVSATNSPRTPVGSVTFRDGAAVLGVVTLDANGKATLATTTLAVGARTLTAQYSGDPNFSGSTSTGLAHAVTPAGVTVQMTDTPDPSVFGGPVALDVNVAAVAPGQGTPSGTVNIREGSTVLATLTLVGGHASTSLSTLPVGAHTLIADYAGDGNFTAGTTSITHTVAGDVATVDLTSSAPTSEFAHPVTFTATVTGTGPAIPTGTVTFLDGAKVLGIATLDANGSASVTVSDLRFGTYLVTAQYTGDAGFGPSNDTITQNVNATGTALTLAASPAAPTVDDIVTLTATVVATNSGQTPTGSVTFFDNGVPLDTPVPVDATGVAKYSRTFDRSVHTITASFTGRPGWGTSSAPSVTVTPGRATATIAVSGSPNPVGVGGNVTWTATMPLSPTGPAPTGSVQFWSGPTSLGSGSISGGVATLTVPTPATLGPWTVFATYNGDLNHEQAVSPDSSVLVTAAGTSTTAVVPATSYATDFIVLRAHVTSTNGSPVVGTVRFTVNSPGVQTQIAAIDGTGWAEVTVSGVPAGNWTLTAAFQPAAGSVLGASSTTAPVLVVRRATAVTVSAPTPVAVGAAFTASFSVTDSTGSGRAPSGTVTVSGGGATCSAPVGVGQCSLTLTGDGTFDLTASYSGDAAFDSSISNPFAITTQGGAPTLTAWSLTSSWVTGDPINITWRLQGPTSGEVVVRTPFGEVCRSTVLDLGSCTITLPFDQRNQTIPVDVTYAGDPSWSAASATVTQPVLGCYPVTTEVRPTDAGKITPPAGNCNGNAGFVAGSRYSITVDAVAPYVVDHWVEDGSTSRAYSFLVGESDHSATVIMTADCKQLTVKPAEQIDLGASRSRSGTVALSTPNCPGRTSVQQDSTGASVGWYARNTSVTVNATPKRPETDELKGWLRDTVLTRSTGPLTVTLTDDVTVEARFGVQCARPTFASKGGGGTVTALTGGTFGSGTCADAVGDGGWQKGSRVGVRVKADQYYWIGDYSAAPIETTGGGLTGPSDPIMNDSTAYFTAEDALHVDISFVTCRQLTIDEIGPGHVEAVTAPNCPTRTIAEGKWYKPTTDVELKAVPNPNSTRPYNLRGADGTVYQGYSSVIPKFRSWDGVDQDFVVDASGRNPQGSQLSLAQDRKVTATFYDEGDCVPLELTAVPSWGVADLDVSLRADPGTCPKGQYSQGQQLGDLATFSAKNLKADKPLVGWVVRTSEGENPVDRLLENDTPDVPIEGQTFAKAYICRAIFSEVKLIAPDKSEQTAPTAPDSDFIGADKDADCPLWDNAYSIGSTVKLAPAASPKGYEFAGWEGDVNSKNEVIELRIDQDGVRWREAIDTPVEDQYQYPYPWKFVPPGETVKVRAVYNVICTRLTYVAPVREEVSIGPKSNCPGADPNPPPADGNGHYRYIGGTALMLDAHHVNKHEFNAWGLVGGDSTRILTRDDAIAALHSQGLDDLADAVGDMDNPAMLTMDDDATLVADYIKHSTGQQITDALAVGAKRFIGIAADFLLGTFEAASGLIFARLLVAAMSAIAIKVDPNGDAAKYFRIAQESFDLIGMTLSCTNTWSKGGIRPDPPPNPFLTPPDKPIPPSANTIQMRRALSSTRKSIKTSIDMAIDEKVLTLTEIKGLPIPTKLRYDKTAKYLKYGKYFNAAVGLAIGIGTALYFDHKDGPKRRYNDTAVEAWTKGGDEYMKCVQQQLSEATDGLLPPPES